MKIFIDCLIHENMFGYLFCLLSVDMIILRIVFDLKEYCFEFLAM